MTKLCQKCKLNKLIVEFHRNRATKDGLCSYCKICKSIIDKANYKLYKTERNRKSKEYYIKNKAKIKAQNKLMYQTPEYKRKAKESRLKNRDKISIGKKNYYQKHKAERNAQWANRRRTNIDVRLANNLRARLNKALHGNHKSTSMISLLGCSLEEFKLYIQLKFKEGMTWTNYGQEWHIDHINPCINFNLKLVEEQQKCFHFSNLQPLWKLENLRKNRY